MLDFQRVALIMLASVLASCASAPPPAATVPDDKVTQITLTGIIDGSEEIRFTPGKIDWVHKHWGPAREVMFCGEPWTDLRETPPMWTDMPHVDLSRAQIVKREGRDTVALEHHRDGFTLYLVDSPNQSDRYSVTIALPGKPKVHRPRQ